MAGPGNTSFKLTIDDEICRVCGHCVASGACRGGAFVKLDKGEPPFIDMSRCWGCLTCMVTCPFGAIMKSDYGRTSPATA